MGTLEPASPIVPLIFLVAAIAAWGYAFHCRREAVRFRREGVDLTTARSLRADLLTERGLVFRTRYHLFLVLGWLAVLMGGSWFGFRAVAA